MATLTPSDAAPPHEHPPHLQHHFDTPAQQFESVVLGMWLFLATEILLFGGLFCAYAVYRANHPEIFEYAHVYLSSRWAPSTRSSSSSAASRWPPRCGPRSTPAAACSWSCSP